MFISVIFDTEYEGMGGRIGWFLKSLSHARQNKWMIITHEYLYTHYNELLLQFNERMYEGMEMQRFSKEELEQVSVCYVPDAIFQQSLEEYGSRTKMIVELCKSDNKLLREYLEQAIGEELAKRNGEKVEGIFVCIQSFHFLKLIAEKYCCPVIPFSFTAIRKIHGYTQTIYMASMRGEIYEDSEIRQRYHNFLNEKIEFEFLSNQEILAILGKERNLPLLSLIDEPGPYEMGIARETYQILPQRYEKDNYTHDDIYYECKHLYEKDEITTRLHQIFLEHVGINREHFQNDPVSFILKCKRVTSLQSQLLLKALLWNRVVCIKSNILPHAFLCQNNYDGEERMKKRELNFLIFSFYIPGKLMYDVDYWRWRMTSPSEKEIFYKHLYSLAEELSIDRIIIENQENRYLKLLQHRNCGPELLARLCEGRSTGSSYHYQYLLSILTTVSADGRTKNLYCLNEMRGEFLYSSFHIYNAEQIREIEFYPLDGVDGFVRLIEIEGLEESAVTWKEKDIYVPKSSSAYRTAIKEGGKKIIHAVFCWQGNTVDGQLRKLVSKE